VDPISGNYVFGSPLFDRIAVDLGNGKRFTIDVERSSPSDCYIQSIQLNGRQYDRLWFAHEDLAAGCSFLLKMASTPNTDFGSAPSALPPSASS
jgi:putative alpha-1,2-mannosidase